MLYKHAIWLLTAATSGFAYAQSNKPEDCVDPNIHIVKVGHSTNQFEPNSINANPGDIVQFQFYRNHSVIQSQYGWPCTPLGAVECEKPYFYSGFMGCDTTGTIPSWNLTINDTSQIFFYSGTPDACSCSGMLGVINPTCDTSLSSQLDLAKKEAFMLEPNEPLGAEASSSLRSLADLMTSPPTPIPSSPTPIPPSPTSLPSSPTSSPSSPTSLPSVSNQLANTIPTTTSPLIPPTTFSTITSTADPAIVFPATTSPSNNVRSSAVVPVSAGASTPGAAIASGSLSVSDTSSVMSSTTAALAGPVPSTTLTGGATQPESSRSKSSKLSGGAIAGIVVGVIAALALIGAILWFCCFRRKFFAQSAATQPQPMREARIPYNTPFAAPFAAEYESVLAPPAVVHRSSEASDAHPIQALGPFDTPPRRSSASRSYNANGLLIPLGPSDPDPETRRSGSLRSVYARLEATKSRFSRVHHVPRPASRSDSISSWTSELRSRYYDQFPTGHGHSAADEHGFGFEGCTVGMQSNSEEHISAAHGAESISGSGLQQSQSSIFNQRFKSERMSSSMEMSTSVRVVENTQSSRNAHLESATWSSSEVSKLEGFSGTEPFKSSEALELGGRSEAEYFQSSDATQLAGGQIRISESLREIRYPGTPELDSLRPKHSKSSELTYVEMPQVLNLAKSKLSIVETSEIGYAETPMTEASDLAFSESDGLDYSETGKFEVTDVRSSATSDSRFSDSRRFTTSTNVFSETSEYSDAETPWSETSDDTFLGMRGSGYATRSHSEIHGARHSSSVFSETSNTGFMKMMGTATSKMAEMRAHESSEHDESFTSSDTKFEERRTRSSNMEIS